jgi:RNase P subunit RPR2
MKPQDSVPRGPLCHRCKRPLVFHLQESVGDRQMRVFHCEFCDTLEAFEAGKAA